MKNVIREITKTNKELEKVEVVSIQSEISNQLLKKTEGIF